MIQKILLPLFSKKNILFFGILFSIFSCNSEKKKTVLPDSIGGINEIILVTDLSKNDSSLQKEVLNAFIRPYPALINLENHFRIITVPSDKFSKYYKTQKNIIFIRRVKNDSSSSISVFEKKNQWAKPQKIVFVNYSKKYSLVKELNKTIKPIFEKYHESEIEYLQKKNAKKTPPPITHELKKQELMMTVPKGFSLYFSDNDDFIWFGRETYNSKKEAKLGVFVHTFPYSDEKQIEGVSILKKRNKITKKYIRGQVDSSYMKIENLIPLIQKAVLFNGNYSLKTRGMWEMEHDFMGGTFINISFVNEEKNKIIMVDGYLYAPNQDKGVFMSELEAIVTSVKRIKPK